MFKFAKTALASFILLTFTYSSVTGAQAYDPASSGTRIMENRTGTSIKMLVESSNLGGNELEIGEITFPVGTESAGHSHGSTELFYILEGELEHTVNNQSFLLTPGMVGIVRAGDDVIHRVPGDQPVKALIIWTPGGEAERLSQTFSSRPVE